MATIKKESTTGYQELYVYMQNVEEKRKNILLGIRDSLIMQQECETIMEIRRNKSLIANEIKKSLETINQLYQDLNNKLPNVKNILAYTEKEVNLLEQQIKVVKPTETKLDGYEESEPEQEQEQEKEQEDSKFKITESVNQELLNSSDDEEENDNGIIPKSTHLQLSKLDRIQNNLKVIEAKLKNL